MKKYHRTKTEKETIILTSEADQTYNVYTFNTSLKKRLASFSAKYPDCCRKIDDSGDGGVTYEIAKGRLSIRLVPPYSEARKKTAHNSILKNRRSI